MVWKFFTKKKKSNSPRKQQKQKKKEELSSSAPPLSSSLRREDRGGITSIGYDEDGEGYHFPRASASTSMIPTPGERTSGHIKRALKTANLKFPSGCEELYQDGVMATSRSAPPLSQRGGVKFSDRDPSHRSRVMRFERSSSSSESTYSSDRSLYIAPKDTLRRSMRERDIGEFISTEEVPVEVPKQLIGIEDLVVVASCQGFENVFLARTDYGRGSYVVFKLFPMNNHEKSLDFCKRPLHEICVFRQVSSYQWAFNEGYKYVVRMYNFYTFPLDNRVVVAMEYCNYGSLLLFTLCYKEKIRRAERMRFARDFTCGLGYLHDLQIAHRDFKLDNIVLTWCNEQNRIVAKIADFGSSSMCTPGVRDLINLGTDGYMAPETLRSEHGYNALPADVWAWAVTLYCLFEPQMPFPQKYNEHRFALTTNEYFECTSMSDVPAFDRIMQECFQMNPLARPVLPEILNYSFFEYEPCEPIVNPKVDDMMRLREKESRKTSQI